MGRVGSVIEGQVGVPVAEDSEDGSDARTVVGGGDGTDVPVIVPDGVSAIQITPITRQPVGGSSGWTATATTLRAQE